jgi:hypothetical protein
LLDSSSGSTFRACPESWLRPKAAFALGCRDTYALPLRPVRAARSALIIQELSVVDL